jgi:hypothetical protein
VCVCVCVCVCVFNCKDDVNFVCRPLQLSVKVLGMACKPKLVGGVCDTISFFKDISILFFYVGCNGKPTLSTGLMFCRPCIIVYQYNESNVMHFSFSLLRIKGLYMFRALLAHPQEALHKRHLLYCVRVMSVGCATTVVNLPPTVD